MSEKTISINIIFQLFNNQFLDDYWQESPILVAPFTKNQI